MMSVTEKKKQQRKPSKLGRMSEIQKSSEITSFWMAPPDAMFPQETLALVFHRSIAWFQLKRCIGDGIPFTKRHGTRVILYKKSDVLDFFGHSSVRSTSEYIS